MLPAPCYVISDIHLGARSRELERDLVAFLRSLPGRAEALLINGDGTPIIVTKEFGRAASIYTPAAPLKTDNTEGVALRKVGEITVPASDTSANTLARIGRATIDGGAVSRDGSKVVLRTYTDALEFDVKNGDVVAALKRWEPDQLALGRRVLARTREAGRRSQFDGTWHVGDPLPFGLYEVGDSEMSAVGGSDEHGVL